MLIHCFIYIYTCLQIKNSFLVFFFFLAERAPRLTNLPVNQLWFPTIHEQNIPKKHSKLLLVKRDSSISSSTSNATPIWISTIYCGLDTITGIKIRIHSRITVTTKAGYISSHTFTSKEDATERAIFAASASLSPPVTVTCKARIFLAIYFW